MLPPVFSYDTETGLCEDGRIRTVLVQLCDLEAESPEDVVLIEGEDCIQRFFEMVELTDHDMDCHAYNLSYESSWFDNYVAQRYQWTELRGRKMPRGSFTVIADPVAYYEWEIKTSGGHLFRMSDDMRRVGSLSMKEAATNIRKSNPEWFAALGEDEAVKDDTELYNKWWLMPPGEERDSFIHYSKLDAFSQARIARWVIENRLNKSLTAAGAGLKMALGIKYADSIDISNNHDIFFSRKDFREKYPPLSREMQDIAERCILAGYVWGLAGTHKGRFWHYDYSSSYPFEYRSGKMFKGKVWRITPDNESWERIMVSKGYMRWLLVSFDFRLKEGMVPAISGRECVSVDNLMTGYLNKKMREGRVTQRLYTESYLVELGKNYDLENLEVYECWFAKRFTGDFKGFIEYCYNQKSRPELKGTMERHIWKLFMNGGIHGKTITKTHRKRIVYEHGYKETVRETNEPTYCFMIGFTAMMNARERLIRHCRMISEQGYTIYMCDTDSMVTDCPPELAHKILGEDTFTREDGGIDNLGKFEMETFEGRGEFDEFRCWGLKRYLELDHGRYRKSAFAGMHEEIQEDILPTWNTDGTVYSWTQKGKHSSYFGKVIIEGVKTGHCENVWFEPFGSVPFDPDRTKFQQLLEGMRARHKRIKDELGEDHLRTYLRDTMIYTEEEIEHIIEEL